MLTAVLLLTLTKFQNETNEHTPTYYVQNSDSPSNVKNGHDQLLMEDDLPLPIDDKNLPSTIDDKNLTSKIKDQNRRHEINSQPISLQENMHCPNMSCSLPCITKYSLEHGYFPSNGSWRDIEKGYPR